MFTKNLFAIALLAIAIIPSPPVSAQEAKSKTLELTIVVDEMPPEEKRIFRVHKDVDVFGKQIENVCLRVDEKTLGLADVLAITRPKSPIENKEPKVHTIQFIGGNFDPPVLVASKGDRLRIVNKSPVPIIPHTVFPSVSSPEESVRGIEVYSLDNNLDFLVELWGNQIGLAHVYVQNKRTCSLTNREGICRVELLPSNELGKRPRIQFLHVYLESLQIKEPTPGLEMVRKNYLEVDFDQVVDGQKLTLVAKLRP
ncbi:MAG: hypothetical protein ACO1RA_06870 [Planctomycetaceae bacterium]